MPLSNVPVSRAIKHDPRAESRIIKALHPARRISPKKRERSSGISARWCAEVWRRGKGRLYIRRRRRFRGCYAPARLHRAPYPLRAAKCLRSFQPYRRSVPRPGRSETHSAIPTAGKIPRGAHSIIRYLCRGGHATHNRRKKKMSIGQETHPVPTPASLKISHSHAHVPSVCNRSFALTDTDRHRLAAKPHRRIY